MISRPLLFGRFAGRRQGHAEFARDVGDFGVVFGERTVDAGELFGLAAADPGGDGEFERRRAGLATQGRHGEGRRLALISDALRAALDASDRYELVDTAPAAQAIAKAGYLYGCNGCEAAIADSLGADLAVAGTVQKVSNLILNINVYLREARQPGRVRVYSVDIRGNTDKSWSRGLSYLVRNRLLRE